MNATSGAGSATVSSLGTIDSEVAQKFRALLLEGSGWFGELHVGGALVCLGYQVRLFGVRGAAMTAPLFVFRSFGLLCLRGLLWIQVAGGGGYSK